MKPGSTGDSNYIHRWAGNLIRSAAVSGFRIISWISAWGSRGIVRGSPRYTFPAKSTVTLPRDVPIASLWSGTSKISKKSPRGKVLSTGDST